MASKWVVEAIPLLPGPARHPPCPTSQDSEFEKRWRPVVSLLWAELSSVAGSPTLCFFPESRKHVSGSLGKKGLPSALPTQLARTWDWKSRGVSCLGSALASFLTSPEVALATAGETSQQHGCWSPFSVEVSCCTQVPGP